MATVMYNVPTYHLTIASLLGCEDEDDGTKGWHYKGWFFWVEDGRYNASSPGRAVTYPIKDKVIEVML